MAYLQTHALSSWVDLFCLLVSIAVVLLKDVFLVFLSNPYALVFNSDEYDPLCGVLHVDLSVHVNASFAW